MSQLPPSPLTDTDRSHALRGNAARDALRSTDDALIEPCAAVMRSVTGSCMWDLLSECISIAAVTATYGFALTATPFFKRRSAGPAKRKQKALPHHSVPRLGSECQNEGIAPWVAAMGNACVRPSWLTGHPDPKPKRGGLKADLTDTGVHGSPVGASPLAKNPRTPRGTRQTHYQSYPGIVTKTVKGVYQNHAYMNAIPAPKIRSANPANW